MRVFGPVITLVLLGALLGVMWAHRFERVADQTVWRMNDLRAAETGENGVKWRKSKEGWVMRVSVEEQEPPVVIRARPPWTGPVERVYARLKVKADQLVAGNKIWEDGRVILEWHLPGGRVEHDGMASARDDLRHEEGGIIITSEQGAAVPVLRIEHLGKSGSFEISELEMMVVRETAAWRIGKWLLAMAWVGWVALSLCGKNTAVWRRWAAGIVWVVIASQFVVPGPWKNQKPLGMPFQIGATETNASANTKPSVRKSAEIPPSTEAIDRIEPLGKLPDKGSLVLRIKQRVAQARPLLHALLLFGPVWVLAVLVGRRPAWVLGVLLAVFIELAQFAFGYGFDLTDVWDLMFNAVGIFGALWCWKKFRRD